MRCDVHLHIKIPGRAAPLAGHAFALELDPLAIGDTGGEAGLDGAGAHRPPATGTHRAGVVDNQPAAPAGPARLGEGEAARVLAGLAGPFAGRADPRHRARLGPRAMTRLARPFPGEPQPDGDAIDGVTERRGRLGLHVGAAPWPGLPGRPLGAEHPTEKVTKPAAGAGVRSSPRPAEQVAEVEPAEPALGASATRRTEPAAEEGTGLVILLAPLLVGQHGVCLGDLLESLLRRRVALVRVRVVLAGELAVRLLDLSGASFVSCCIPPRSGRPRPGPASCCGPGSGRAVRAVPIVTGFRDRDPGRPEDPVAHPVTGLQDLDAGWLGNLRGVRVHEGLVHPWVEGLAGIPEALQAKLGRGRLQGLADRLDPAVQLAVFPGPADVVEDRHQSAEHVGQRLLAHRHPVPLDALAVVRVFRLYTLQVSSAFSEPVRCGAAIATAWTSRCRPVWAHRVRGGPVRPPRAR